MRRLLDHDWLCGHRADHDDADPLGFLRPFRPPQGQRAEPDVADHGWFVRSVRRLRCDSLGAIVAGLAVLIVIAATLAYLIITMAAR